MKLYIYKGNLYHLCISMYKNRYVKESGFFVCKSCNLSFPAFLALGFKVRESIYLEERLEYYIGSSVGILLSEVKNDFFEKSIEL